MGLASWIHISSNFSNDSRSFSSILNFWFSASKSDYFLGWGYAFLEYSHIHMFTYCLWVFSLQSRVQLHQWPGLQNLKYWLSGLCREILRTADLQDCLCAWKSTNYLALPVTERLKFSALLGNLKRNSHGKLYSFWIRGAL